MILLTSAIKILVNESLNKNFVLEIQVFTFILSIIISVIDSNILF